MKFQTSLSVLAFVATSQLVFAQRAPQANDDTVAVQTVNNVEPASETGLPDIYWWKTLLTDEEISRYLPEPAQTAGATGAAVPTAAPSVTDAAAATDAIPSNGVSDAASGTSSVSAATDISASASASVSDASVTGISAAATEASSTSAPSAWSSSSGSAGSPAVATSANSQSIAVPKPSGGSIPPATSSNAVNHTSKATHVTSELSRVLFSVAAISAALFKFLN